MRQRRIRCFVVLSTTAATAAITAYLFCTLQSPLTQSSTGDIQPLPENIKKDWPAEARVVMIIEDHDTRVLGRVLWIVRTRSATVHPPEATKFCREIAKASLVGVRQRGVNLAGRRLTGDEILAIESLARGEARSRGSIRITRQGWMATMCLASVGVFVVALRRLCPCIRQTDPSACGQCGYPRQPSTIVCPECGTSY